MKNRSRITLLVMVLLAALGFTLTDSVKAADPARPGAIMGVVVARSADGPVGVAGAAVQLVSAATGRAVAQTRSGDDGRFSFRDVRPGRYMVTAVKPEVGRGNAAVAVVSGQIARVRVGLVGR